VAVRYRLRFVAARRLGIRHDGTVALAAGVGAMCGQHHVQIRYLLFGLGAALT